ncbi:MAG: Lrp/AsnC family transcriptional regulator [Nanoarchaeota archaeon]
MKDIRPQLIRLLREGYCTPQLSRMAKKTQQPTTTLQYNIKKLEREGAVRTYKAVFDYPKIGEGFCAYALINLATSEYADPEQVARELARHSEIESIDMITGEWEMILKIRAKDQEAYYTFIKGVLSKPGIQHIKTLVSLNQVKTEFVAIQGSRAKPNR